jgi:hypothetical protein
MMMVGTRQLEDSAIRPEHEGVAAPKPEPHPLMQNEKR